MMPLFPPKNPRHDPNLHHFVIYRSNALEEYLAARKGNPLPDVMSDYPFRKTSDVPHFAGPFVAEDLKSVLDLSLLWRLVKNFMPNECVAMPCATELVIQLSACSRAHIQPWDHENGSGYTIYLYAHEVVARKLIMMNPDEGPHDAIQDTEDQMDYVMIKMVSCTAEYGDDRAPIMIQGLLAMAELLDIAVELSLSKAQVVTINEQSVMVV